MVFLEEEIMKLEYVSYLIILNTILYLTSFILHFFKKENKMLLYLAVFFNLATLIVRSIIAKHPPITNAYETVLLFSFLISLRLIFWTKQISKTVGNWIILAVVGLNILSLVLPETMKTPRPLMPALNSFWMYIHVPAYMVGYATLAIAFVYAIILFL
ncbi:MAG TPA: hypothetical protein ENK92_03830, partial [Bacteroidetes bacterium]|nr:hypothetical protein [Bacteroidota bacterium]